MLKLLNEYAIDILINKLVNSNKLKLIDGSSAGAKVLGGKVIYQKNNVLFMIDGLNIIEGYIIDPHFNKKGGMLRLKDLIDHLDSGYTGLGIDEDTTITPDEEYNIIDSFGLGKLTILTKDFDQSY